MQYYIRSGTSSNVPGTIVPYFPTYQQNGTGWHLYLKKKRKQSGGKMSSRAGRRVGRAQRKAKRRMGAAQRRVNRRIGTAQRRVGKAKRQFFGGLKRAGRRLKSGLENVAVNMADNAMDAIGLPDDDSDDSEDDYDYDEEEY